MRIGTLRIDQGRPAAPAVTRAARIDGNTVTPLDAPDVRALLANPDWAAQAAATEPDTGERLPLTEVTWATLVPEPTKFVCVGLNYRNHIAELGREMPTHPTLFCKFSDALIGASDDIHLPPESTKVDWEAELGVVIGRRVRRCSRDAAASAVAGFTVVNDISMRDWQNRTSEWLQGKTWEHSTPVGPWFVTPDEVGGVTPDLRISTSVDGVVRQSDQTGQLLFDPLDLIAYVSTIVTLNPGDIIATGTPGGVGMGCRPAVFLSAGQRVVTRIEGIGVLSNRVTEA